MPNQVSIFLAGLDEHLLAQISEILTPFSQICALMSAFGLTSLIRKDLLLGALAYKLIEVLGPAEKMSVFKEVFSLALDATGLADSAPAFESWRPNVQTLD